MKKERNGAVPGQETNLEYTAHLLEAAAAAAAAAPGFSGAAPPPLGSHTGSFYLYDWETQRETTSSNEGNNGFEMKMKWQSIGSVFCKIATYCML